MDVSVDKLLAYLKRLPAISGVPQGKVLEDGNWWVKFSIDTDHPLAWRHVQELGHVLNYLSLLKRLPTVFMPVSPPPYINGGVEFLSWLIESKNPSFTPDLCAEWLLGRLPRPPEDLEEWDFDEMSDEHTEDNAVEDL